MRSKRQKETRGGQKTDTQAKKTKNLVSKLYRPDRVHEPKPNLGPTGIPNEQSSLGESSPQKGVHHRRSQMQADALMQQTHPSIPEPEEENQTRQKLQADSVHTALHSTPCHSLCVSHTPIISLSVSQSARVPTPDMKQLRRNGSQVSIHHTRAGLAGPLHAIYL